MLTILKSLLWDPAAARAALLGLATMAGVYLAQPDELSLEKRIAAAITIGLGIGGASLPSQHPEKEDTAEQKAVIAAAPPVKP